jgi:chromosome segregation ATPase
MTVITTDRVAGVREVVTKIMAQGETLLSDIIETADDRARLLVEAGERETSIEQLNSEIDRLANRNAELEKRNATLVDHNVELDNKLRATETRLHDANTRLASIHREASPEPPQRDGNGVVTPSLATMLRRTDQQQHRDQH